MKKQLLELQQLNGIGEVLARRLIESSYDSIAKVAGAEEKGLARIPVCTLERSARSSSRPGRKQVKRKGMNTVGRITATGAKWI